MDLLFRVENGLILTVLSNPHLDNMLCDNADALIASLR